MPIETATPTCLHHHTFTILGLGGLMEDYEEQEVEFWRKLQEMDMSRS